MTQEDILIQVLEQGLDIFVERVPPYICGYVKGKQLMEQKKVVENKGKYKNKNKR